MTAILFRTRFQHDWIEISERLGLSIHLSFEVPLKAKVLMVPVLLEGHGAMRGMLLIMNRFAMHPTTSLLSDLAFRAWGRVPKDQSSGKR